MKYYETKVILIIIVYLAVHVQTREILKKTGINPSSFIAKENIEDDFGDFNMEDLILNDSKLPIENKSVSSTNIIKQKSINKVNNKASNLKVLNKVTKLKITSNYPKKHTNLTHKIKQKEITKVQTKSSFKEKKTDKKTKKESKKTLKIPKIKNLNVEKEKIILKKESNNLISKLNAGFLNDLLKLQNNPFFTNIYNILKSNKDLLNYNINFIPEENQNKNENVFNNAVPNRINEKFDIFNLSNNFNSKIINPNQIKSLFSELDNVRDV